MGDKRIALAMCRNLCSDGSVDDRAHRRILLIRQGDETCVDLVQALIEEVDIPKLLEADRDIEDSTDAHKSNRYQTLARANMADAIFQSGRTLKMLNNEYLIAKLGGVAEKGLGKF